MAARQKDKTVGRKNNGYGAALDAILPIETDVVHELWPETEGKEVDPGDIGILRRGNPTIVHTLHRNTCAGRPYAFSARCYGDRGPDIPNFPTLGHLSYRLLREAGVRVPRTTVLHAENPDKLFIEFIEGQTLGQLMERLERTQQGELIKELVPRVRECQKKATAYARKHQEKIKSEGLFWSRPVEKQALDYLGVVLGSNDYTREIAEGTYLPLFQEGLEGHVVILGDLSPDNIIVEQDTGLYYWIDSELKVRDAWADIGGFLAYLGNFESVWEQLAQTDLREGIQSSRYRLLSNVAHYSLRITAKRITYDQDFQPQLDTLHSVLEAFAQNPADFGLSDEKSELAKRLQGYIPRTHKKTESQ